MTQDQNKAIALIIPLIVKNNAGKVAIALKNSGYSKKYIPQAELEAKLFQFYIANPDGFFAMMKTIPWNYGEIETNKPEIRDELIKLVAAGTENEVSKDTWWQELIAILSEKAPDPAPAQRKAPSKSKKYGMGILLLLAFVGIVTAIYLLFD